MLPTSFVEQYPTAAALINLLICIAGVYGVFTSIYTWNFRRKSTFLGLMDFDEQGNFKGAPASFSRKLNVVVAKGLGEVRINGDVEIEGDFYVGRDTLVIIEGRLISCRGNIGKGQLRATGGEETTY